MYSKKNILQKIIKEDNFCCLCFNNIDKDTVCFNDEVGIGDEPHKINIKVAEILNYLLGNDVFQDISSIIDACCVTCTLSAVKCYSFISEIKSRYTNYVSVAIEELNNCLDNSMLEDLKNCKTLFIAMNPETSENNLYFDITNHCKDYTDALNKFNIISKVKTHKLSEVKKEELMLKSNSKFKLPEMYDKNKELKCTDCSKTFSNVSNLKSHYLRLHTRKHYKCSTCPKKFYNETYLEMHKEECQISYICMECGKKFNNKNSLYAHENAHNVKFICEDCGRVYKNINTFKQHVENNICQMKTRHSPADAKFTCDYCQKRYTQKMTLRVHIQYEHLNYKHHECKWCKKKFSCQSRLKAHIVKHTRERNFKCNICERKFVTKEALLYHTRLHTGEQPYECPHCDCRFISASRRAFHVKRQHVLATAECDICHSNFTSYHYLQKHKKIHIEKSKTVNIEETKPEVNNFMKNEINVIQSPGKKETAIGERNKVYYSINSQGELTQQQYVKNLETIKHETVKNEPEFNVVYSVINQGKLIWDVAKNHDGPVIEIHPNTEDAIEHDCKINDDTQSQNTDDKASRRAFHVKRQHVLAPAERDICHSNFTSYHYLQKHKKIHIEKSKTVNIEETKPEVNNFMKNEINVIQSPGKKETAIGERNKVYYSINSQGELTQQQYVKNLETIKHETVKNEPEFNVVYSVNNQGELIWDVAKNHDGPVIEIHPNTEDAIEYDFKINDDTQSQNTDDNERVYLEMYDNYVE